MSPSLLFRIKIFVIVFLSAPIAYGAEGAHGGGNIYVQLNSPQQVIAAIDYSKRDLVRHLDAATLHNGKLIDDEIHQILKVMMGPLFWLRDLTVESPVEKVLRETRFKKSWRACRGSDGKAKDASVKLNDPKSAICFSISRLQTVDLQFLQAQTTALLAHEIAHKFGYDERVAQKFQRFLFDAYLNPVPHAFSYVGRNVRLMNVQDISDRSGHIRLDGSDAKAIYQTLKVREMRQNDSFTEPPHWVKTSTHIKCKKFDNPIPPGSSYAQRLKEDGHVDIRVYDYSCQIKFDQETGAAAEQ